MSPKNPVLFGKVLIGDGDPSSGSPDMNIAMAGYDSPEPVGLPCHG